MKANIVNRIKLKQKVIILLFSLFAFLLAVNVLLIYNSYHYFSQTFFEGKIKEINKIIFYIKEELATKDWEMVTHHINLERDSNDEIAFFIVQDKKELDNIFTSSIDEEIPYDYLTYKNIITEGEVISSVDYKINNERIFDIAFLLDDDIVFRVGFFTKRIDNQIFLLFHYRFFIVLIIGVSIIFYFFIKLIFNPLQRLKKSLKKVTEGELVDLVYTNKNDEIGELVYLINGIIDDLRHSQLKIEAHNKELEEVVKVKTSELRILLDKLRIEKEELDKKSIEGDKVQEQLKSTNKILKKREYELEALKSLGDELTSVLTLRDATKNLNLYLSEVMDFTVATYVVADINNEGGVYFSYNREVVNHSFYDLAEKDIKSYLSKINSQESKSVSEVVDKSKFEIIGEEVNEKKKNQSNSTLILPLEIAGRLIGVIHFSSTNTDGYKEGINDLVMAMISSYAMFVSRLQSFSKSQQSRTESLVESLHDGVIMFNNDHEVLLANNTIRDILKADRKNIQLSDINKILKISRFKQKINSVLKSNKIYELSDVELDGKYYDLFMITVKDDRGKVYGGAMIFHDITSMKKINIMKSEFVSVASHQLRTPITSVKLFAEMLVKEQAGKLKKKQKEYINIIYQSIERMSRLVNDLLNVSRIESGRLKIDPQMTKIGGFIKSIIVDLNPVAEIKNVAIEYLEDEEAPEIPIDHNLFRQVIHNLITNAIRYAHEEGGLVLVSSKKEGKYLLIKISDNGIGIPKEKQDRIFEKFYRADNAVKVETEGTGLGLYVSKMIVDSSNGKIWFDSSEKGTNFYVKMPIRGMKKKKGDRSIINK